MSSECLQAFYKQILRAIFKTAGSQSSLKSYNVPNDKFQLYLELTTILRLKAAAVSGAWFPNEGSRRNFTPAVFLPKPHKLNHTVWNRYIFWHIRWGDSECPRGQTASVCEGKPWRVSDRNLPTFSWDPETSHKYPTAIWPLKNGQWEVNHAVLGFWTHHVCELWKQYV